MALSTFSTFYFGLEITSTNRFLNFNEGVGELSASLAIGSTTLNDILSVVKTSMDNVGTLTYTVSVNRITRLVTISSTSPFDLLIGTGSQKGSSPFSLLGFTGSIDLTGLSSYTGDSPAGSEFQPQFILQDFVSSDNSQQRIDSTVNESANGEIEIVTFGTRKITKFSFNFITDIPQDGRVIKSNGSGIADAQAFMQNIIGKKQIEFMKDVGNRNSVQKLLLETTPTSDKGTGYELDELTSQNLPGYFEIKNLTFRVLT